MNDDNSKFLRSGRLPARLSAQEVSQILGFSDKVMATLIAATLLVKPRGQKPNSNQDNSQAPH